MIISGGRSPKGHPIIKKVRNKNEDGKKGTSPM
jgi:hypothetical protein